MFEACVGGALLKFLERFSSGVIIGSTSGQHWVNMGSALGQPVVWDGVRNVLTYDMDCPNADPHLGSA